MRVNPEAPLLRPKNGELCAGIAGMNIGILLIIMGPFKGWVVSRLRWLGLIGLTSIGLSLVVFASPVAGQGLRSVVESHDRVFPGVGAGVTALKRDSSGRYYVLAKPETVISVFGPDGILIGQIPNAKSNGATIRYAVDIDLNPDGFLVVADRGSNAIVVFAPDGSFVSTTPVVAPTSVVALSDGQFAVTSLVSKRLVEVIDQRGKVVRSFGDPIQVEDQPDQQPSNKEQLMNRGRVSGDSAGGIYFAFTSVPDPTVRQYDRYGYVGYEALIPAHVFGETPQRPNDRFEYTFGFSDESFSDQFRSSVTLGSSGDLKFSGGVGTGFGEALRRGEGFDQAIQQQTTGGGGGPLGAMFSGQVSRQGANFQLGMGTMSGGRGRMGFGSVSDQTNSQGAALQFNSSNSNDTSDLSQPSSSVDPSSMSAELQSSFGSNGTGATDPFSDSAAPLPGGGGLGQGGLSGAFVLGSGFGTGFGSFGFRQGGFGGGFGGHEGGAGGSTTGSGAHSAGAGSGIGMHGADGSSHLGYRGGHFGSSSYAFTGGMRVNLGDLGRVSSFDKPIITAMAADPETHEIWAGIGDTLVHFNKDGDPVGIYYLTLSGGTALKPVAVLVEPDRLLIAGDPWGIFEFARPDKAASSPKQQLNIVPQVVPQPR
jgi:hypothetical protein